MLLWPEMQKKAQEEIDRVVGNDRVPDFGDREHLPYTEALIKECMRLHTAVPASMYHDSSPESRQLIYSPTGSIRIALNDDVVDGFLIPKGSTVMPNVW